MSEDQQQNEEEGEEAVLKLKIINAENLKPPPTFLTKYKSYILVWIDPRHKQTTQTLTTSTKNPTYDHHLTFPLSLRTLQNPNSRITLQLISPIIGRNKKVIGSTSMLLSDVKFDDRVCTLQLWRPSGRAHGLIRVSAKVEIRDFGFNTCVTGIPLQMNHHIQSQPFHFGQMELGYAHHNVLPSAPPVESEEGDNVVEPDMENVHVERLDVDCGSASSCDCSSNVSSGCGPEAAVRSDGPNVLRSLLVGFLGGAVAVATVLVGSNTS